MIFIDFDDVIFNTGEFKRDFKNMFIENGISAEIFDKYYNDPNDNRAIKTFDPWKQIERMHRDLDIDTKHITSLVNVYISDISSYVFDDVENFVNKFKQEKICIVSFGEKEFQTKKIENSQISKIIKNVAITENSKSETIAQILKLKSNLNNEKNFFIDDRVEQIGDVKSRFPDMITIFMKRPEGRYQEMQKENCCNYQVCNLTEAAEIIEKYEEQQN
ncbi:MAG: hypothetical protein ACD_5C00306G0001 [uncultured bacterium]|nr:MAG: hypothetical protein ACD_5C00306G0001 [uncultured bacterium]